MHLFMVLYMCQCELHAVLWSHTDVFILFIVEHIIPSLKESKSIPCIRIEVRSASCAVHRKKVHVFTLQKCDAV